MQKEKQRHPNRKSKREGKQQSGVNQIVEDNAINSENFKLDWFKPTSSQK